MEANMKTRIFSLFGTMACIGLIGLASCRDDSSDRVQQDQQEILLKQATNATGMPSITRFTERKMLKAILELRDSELATVTYIVDLQGHAHKLCNSVGYGLPYATQYTSPQKLDTSVNHYVVLPQADPNGLFSPASADGTWIMCLNPETKKAAALYVEPRVIVSPFELPIEVLNGTAK
jgi:hypothetical protein